MSSKKTRLRPSSMGSPRKTAPPGRSRRWFVFFIALIAIPGLGLWIYLTWIGRQWAPSNAPSNRLATTPVNRRLSTTETAGPRWKRSCDDSTCGWITDDDQVQKWNQIDNATSDGWDTEAFTAAAMQQFEKLKGVLTHEPAFADSALQFIVANDARFGKLLPDNLETTFRDSAIHVQRAKAIDPLGAGEQARAGIAGLAQSLRELLAPFQTSETTRLKIKIFRVEKNTDSIQTLQTLEVFGPIDEGVREITAIWVARWDANTQPPTLKDLAVTEFETAHCARGGLFADCTESVLAQTDGFQNQLLRGYNHWLNRSQFQRFFDLLGTPGVAVGDVNGDGLEDLYVCQEGGLPNLLFVQRADGSLDDVSKGSQVDWLQQSRTALIVDLNNDGHEDLAVGVDGGVVLAEGDGTGKFIKRAVLDSSDDVLALAAADYDLDGRLDLYVGVYYPNEYSGEAEEESISTPGFVYYDAKTGGPNSMFHNEIAGGNWRFRETTHELGLDHDNARYTLAAAFEDVDNDGDQDLYVANDYGPKNLFRNDRLPDGRQTFVDIAHEANAEDYASGMSVAWGDYDRDGWMDIYVSNMFSYAGNRIMYQSQFKPDAGQEIKQTFQRFARGNTLLKNLGQSESIPALQFEDRSLAAAVNRGRWAWGSAFVDINNDGWEDLVVANGYITTENSGDL